MTNCVFPAIYWVNDGFCDDESNIEACFYDGGDCCGTEANFDYCTECECKAPQEGCASHIYVGDGICDLFNMNQECLFDGGDCNNVK